MEEILFDYSKNKIDSLVLDQLISLAEELKLHDAIESMFNGEKINETENRAVLHTALRNFSEETLNLDGLNIIPAIRNVGKNEIIFQ